MKIENVDLELFIDYIGKTVHLLEISRSPYSALLNEISPEFQKKVIEKGLLLMDVLDFDWFCYASSGLVMEYKDYGLLFVSKNENRLHKPFIGVLGSL